MPPKARKHKVAASSHAVAVESLRKQRKEVQSTLRKMLATLKQDEMLEICNDYIRDMFGIVLEAVPGTVWRMCH
jgi:hypothetical protein